MVVQKLARFLNSKRVRALWQSDTGWHIIGLLPWPLKQYVKATYRRILVVPTVLPTKVQTHVDSWNHNKPMLSVVIPCYNHGRYIRDTLRSLEMQTFRDFETIVVDDGSNEELTIRVLDDLRKEGIKVFRQKKLNVATALNFGIRAARGRYACCVAADDKLESTYLEKCLCLLESNPGVAIAYSLVRTFGYENRIWLTESFDLRLLLEYNYICAAAVFRRSVWEQVGGFDEAIDGYEDWDFWLKAGKAGFRGRLIPEALFNYRRHGATLNIRSDRKYRELTEHIRKNHDDIYSYPERTKEIENTYSDIRVPNPFVNLSLKIQYANLREPEGVIITSAEVARLFGEKISGAARQNELIKALFVTIDPESSRPSRNDLLGLSTQFYHLRNFLDPYCHLDFLLNLMSTRSARLVVVWDSALAYEWISAIKSRSPVLVISVIGDRSEFVRLSAKWDQFIDVHVTLSEYAMRSLTHDFGVRSEKVRLISSVLSSDKAIELSKILTIYAKTQRTT